MQGKRVNNNDLRIVNPCEYYRLQDGTWHAMTPNGHLANLAGHKVTEHDDLTITVSPSIKVNDQTGELWHGYLERGVWR